MTNSEQSDSLGGPGGQGFFEDVKNDVRRRGPLYAGGAAFVLLLILGVVIWASYPRQGVADPNAAPLIRADAAPYRVKPDDPGGMTIPYRDSTVFNALHGEDDPAGGKVENLLPQPEQPLPREKLIPGFKAGAAVPAPVPSTASPSQALPPAGGGLGGGVTPASTVTADAPPVKNTEAKAVMTVPSVVAPPTQPSPSREGAILKDLSRVVGQGEGKEGAGGYFVQLGSVAGESEAAPMWKKMQASYPALAGLSLHVEKADLGAKGVHYRLQGGPLAQEKAKNICAAVTAKKPGGCFVIKH